MGQRGQFKSKLIWQQCELLRIAKSLTTPYRQCANAKVERFNRTFCPAPERCARAPGEVGADAPSNPHGVAEHAIRGHKAHAGHA